MKIQILGTGCSKCGTLYQAAQEAVQQSGVEFLNSRTEHEQTFCIVCLH